MTREFSHFFIKPEYIFYLDFGVLWEWYDLWQIEKDGGNITSLDMEQLYVIIYFSFHLPYIHLITK